MNAQESVIGIINCCKKNNLYNTIITKVPQAEYTHAEIRRFSHVT